MFLFSGYRFGASSLVIISSVRMGGGCSREWEFMFFLDSNSHQKCGLRGRYDCCRKRCFKWSYSPILLTQVKENLCKPRWSCVDTSPWANWAAGLYIQTWRSKSIFKPRLDPKAGSEWPEKGIFTFSNRAFILRSSKTVLFFYWFW